VSVSSKIAWFDIRREAKGIAYMEIKKHKRISGKGKINAGWLHGIRIRTDRENICMHAYGVVFDFWDGRLFVLRRNFTCALLSCILQCGP
jgi:hypothetical protein